jgi:hypothetical protein
MTSLKSLVSDVIQGAGESWPLGLRSEEVEETVQDIVNGLSNGEILALADQHPRLMRMSSLQKDTQDFPHEVARSGLENYLISLAYVTPKPKRRYVFFDLVGNRLEIVGLLAPEMTPFDKDYDTIKGMIKVWNE